MLDAVRAGEKSSAVAMTNWHERLYLAWTGTDTHLRLAWSPDARNIVDTRRLDQQSYTVGGGQYATSREPVAPALAGSAEHLYLAWTDTDHGINILADPENSRGAPVRLEEARSYHPPALCSHQGTLVLAWTSRDAPTWGGISGHINILADPESPHGAPVRLEEARSYHPPALCSHQGTLVLAWTGTDHRTNILADPESLRGAPVRLEEAWSYHPPALCSHQGTLVLAWTSRDAPTWRGSGGHINILADPESPHGAPVRLEEARSYLPPALCSHQGSLVLAWSGTDRHLNLARLQ